MYPCFAWLKFCMRTLRDIPAPRRELDWGSQHQAGSSMAPTGTLGDVPAPSTQMQEENRCLNTSLSGRSKVPAGLPRAALACYLVNKMCMKFFHSRPRWLRAYLPLCDAGSQR